MRRTSRLLVVVAALAAQAALAHEKGGERAMGVVETVAPDLLVLRAADGHLVPFALDAGTRFFVGDRPASAADVRAGQRAVVQGKRTGETVTARRVRLSRPGG